MISCRILGSLVNMWVRAFARWWACNMYNLLGAQCALFSLSRFALYYWHAFTKRLIPPLTLYLWMRFTYTNWSTPTTHMKRKIYYIPFIQLCTTLIHTVRCYLICVYWKRRVRSKHEAENGSDRYNVKHNAIYDCVKL